MALRVFMTGPSTPGTRVDLDRDESHYLLRVRRARVGAALEVFDGVGGSYRGRLLEAGRVAVIALDERIPPPEPLGLHLLLAIPESTAALEALVNATELGATRVTWVQSAYSHGRPPTPPRTTRVLRACMRQCGRPTPPDITGPVALEGALTRDDSGAADLRLLAAEQLRGAPATPLPSWKPNTTATLLVGPEGGFRDDEIEAARAAGWTTFGLGPWILRTPTAVAAGLSRILALRAP